MRKLAKLAIPDLLAQKASNWLNEYKNDQGNSTKRYRYRDQAIKSTLKNETFNKCVYCESKIGHNTPGDVEHKIPTSKNIDLHFDWNNLTIACTECNRRKNDYYSASDSFLDPYLDDVEDLVLHLGPVVSWKNGDSKAEISVKTLELHSNARENLISRKIEKIEELNNLVERYNKETNPTLKKIHKKGILRMMEISSEYSAMIISILKTKNVI